MSTGIDRAGQISNLPSQTTCLTAPKIRSITRKGRESYYEDTWNNYYQKIPLLLKCLFYILKELIFPTYFRFFLF